MGTLLVTDEWSFLLPPALFKVRVCVIVAEELIPSLSILFSPFLFGKKKVLLTITFRKPEAENKQYSSSGSSEKLTWFLKGCFWAAPAAAAFLLPFTRRYCISEEFSCWCASAEQIIYVRNQARMNLCLSPHLYPRFCSKEVLRSEDEVYLFFSLITESKLKRRSI